MWKSKCMNEPCLHRRSVDVSVVMCVLNGAAFVEAAISSILGQVSGVIYLFIYLVITMPLFFLSHEHLLSTQPIRPCKLDGS